MKSMEEIYLKEDDLSILEEILGSYLSDSYKSRSHKLDSKFGCIDLNRSDTIEDICYFAARDISESGNLIEFAEFLEHENEIFLASQLHDLIGKYKENVTSEKEELNENTIVPLKPQITMVELIQKIEKSLRKIIPSEPKPDKEFEIHDAVEHLLTGTQFEGTYSRDNTKHPFSVTSSIPDFVFEEISLALEVKLCKTKKQVKSIVNEISEDITKYKKRYPKIIFLVYDLGFIQDEDLFRHDFEEIENIKVVIKKH